MAYYDYRISNMTTSLVTGTGTISTSAGSTTLSGGSSAFTTQAHVGDVIVVGGLPIGSIAVITNNTTATLAVAADANRSNVSYQIDPMVNVEDLVKTFNQLPPKGDYQPWSVVLPTGDGLARGMGRATAQWRWNFGPLDFLTDALRDALRAYCSGKSARVYIRTRTFESTDKFVTFQAAMLWPDKEDRDFKGHRKGFVIDFRDLIPL